MTALRPWRDVPQHLPPELARALAARPGEPSQTEVQDLANRLSATLGVPLGGAVAKGTVALVKPSLGVVGSLLTGVAVGVGLSTLATLSLGFADSPEKSRKDPVPGLVIAKPVVASSMPNAVAPPDPVAPPARPQPGPAVRGGAAARSNSAVPLANSLQAVESELSLLRRARAALASEPLRALALCEEHARSFGQGALVQEREVIAIDALVRSARLVEARARGRSFELRFPSSAHAPRLAALLGTGTERR